MNVASQKDGCVMIRLSELITGPDHLDRRFTRSSSIQGNLTRFYAFRTPEFIELCEYIYINTVRDV